MLISIPAATLFPVDGAAKTKQSCMLEMAASRTGHFYPADTAGAYVSAR